MKLLKSRLFLLAILICSLIGGLIWFKDPLGLGKWSIFAQKSDKEVIIEEETEEVLVEEEIEDLFRQEEPLPRIDISHDYLTANTFIADDLVTNTQLEASKVLKEQNPNLRIRWSPITGTPSRISVRDGFLKSSSQGFIGNNTTQDTLLQFVQDEAELFNLTQKDLETLSILKDNSIEGSGIIAQERRVLPSVTFDQRWQGKQVYPVTFSGTFSIDQNSILSVSGGLVPDLESAINTNETTLSSIDALEKAANNIGASFDPKEHPLLEKPKDEDPEHNQTFEKGTDFEYDVPAKLIYFRIAKTDVRLVWRFLIAAKGSPFTYQVLVDAVNGEVLLRENLTQMDRDVPKWLAYANVLNNSTTHPKDDYQPNDNPAPLSPSPTTPNGKQGNTILAELIQTNGDSLASPKGWIESNQTSTEGNNVTAYHFSTGNKATATLEEVNGIPTRIFNFPVDFSVSPGNATNKSAAIVNAFFLANWYHDRLFHLGFTEAEGNFQKINYNPEKVTAKGNDQIVIKIHQGVKNNPRFSSHSEDGTFARLQLPTWDGPNIERDAGLDNEILIHELTHGLTKRMLISELKSTAQLRGLSEGYSDIFALLLLRQPEENPDGNYSIGGYSAFEFDGGGRNPLNWRDNYYFGVRHFPYSTNFCVNPFTLEDMQERNYDITTIPSPGEGIDIDCEKIPPVAPWLANRSEHSEGHDMGEIWALMLWEVRRNLIEEHGFAGNEIMLELLINSFSILQSVEELELTFAEARYGLIDADHGLNSGENKCLIWKGFAKRGLGYLARTPNKKELDELGQPKPVTDDTFFQDFSLPEECNGIVEEAEDNTEENTEENGTGILPSSLSDLRLTFITSQSSSISDLKAYLEENGAKVSLIEADNLQRLDIIKPDIIIVGVDTKNTWKKMSKSVLSSIFENHKIIGIGEGGIGLFHELGLEIDSVMHGSLPQIIVENQEILQSPFSISEDLQVYISSQGFGVIGVYDEGSPTLAGFEGIARWENHANHWPIARQGNYALWGFNTSFNEIKDEGLKLFVNLLVNHKSLPSVPLSQALKKLTYVKSGLIADRLNAQFSGHSWPFQVKKTGRISAKLSYNPTALSVALILNGPGQVGYYDRVDGSSPLSIEFDVTKDHIVSGTDWQISVKAFEDLGNNIIDYELQLSLP